MPQSSIEAGIGREVRFALLLTTGLSASMSYGVTLPLLPGIVDAMAGSGASVARQTGWLTAAYTVALFAFSPVWGWVSDRIDHRWVMAAGLLGAAASLVALQAATSLQQVYTARILAGAVTAAVLPALLAHVARTTVLAKRQRRFAWVASATALGFLLGPVASSAAALLPRSLSGLELVGMVCVLAALAAAATRNSPEDSGEIAVTTAAPSPAADGMGLALLLTVAVVFGITVAEVGLTLRGGPVAPYFALCSFLMVAMQLAGYPVLERWMGEHRLVIAALFVMAVGIALLALRELWAPAAAFALAASALGVLIPALAVRISSAAGQRQGWAMGRQAAASNLGQAGGAAVTGVLFAVATPAPFLLAGSLLAAAAVAAARQRRGFAKVPRP